MVATTLSFNDIKSQQKLILKQLEVPLELYVFYDPEEIARIGDKLAPKLFVLDNYFFYLGKQMRCFYQIEYFLKNPDNLVKLIENS